MTKPIMVASTHLGVFGGLVPDDQDLTVKTITLDECRIVDEFGRFDDDVNRLATEGPDATASISTPAEMTIHDITAVWAITPAAWTKWQAGVWAPVGSRRGDRIGRTGGER